MLYDEVGLFGAKEVQAGDSVCGKSASTSAGILIEEGSINYVARSKQLPRAQGATRGDLGGGVPGRGLHRPRNESDKIQRFFNTVELFPRRSFIGKLVVRLSLAEIGGKDLKEDGTFYTG